MAIAIASGPAVLPINSVPTVRATITTITGDTSYTTGGAALTAAQLGLSTLGSAICTVSGSAANNTASQASYNLATGKLQMWSNTDAAGCPLAETANTTNVSGLTVTVLAFGV